MSKILNKSPITGQDIPYGSWGYGLQTPIADAIRKSMNEHKAAFEDEPNTRIHYENKGAYTALSAIVDAVHKVESEYSKSIVERLNRERHSGHGRGDSMG